MNDHEDDPILEALLSEVLGEESPPDLTARILHAWSPVAVDPATRTLVRDETQAPLDLPLIRPARTGSASPFSAPTSGRSAIGKTVLDRWVAGRMGAIAAALLLIGGGVVLTALNSNWIVNPDRTAAERAPSAPTQQSPLDVKSLPRGSQPRPTVPQRRGESRETSTHMAEVEAPGRRTSELTLPFESDLPKPTAPSPPAAKPKSAPLARQAVIEAINGQLQASWQAHRIARVESASDSEWCRRVYLRLVGRIPTVEELQQFVKDRSSSKRATLVQSLLDGEEYAQAWSRHWTNVLIGRTGGTSDDDLGDRAGLQEYLAEALRTNKRFDTLAYELLAATGSNQRGADDYNGAVNFLLASWNPKATLATSRTARIFLGRQIDCLQCHDHPTNDAWTQNGFWELNAFFRQTHVEPLGQGAARVRDPDQEREGESTEVYYERRNGEIKVAYPVLPDGGTGGTDSTTRTAKRRQVLARYIADAPELARATANRVWAQFFGYGFTLTVDDMGPHAAVSHPELLELIANQFAAHDYDLKQLLAWIALSDPFSVSSKITSENAVDAPERGERPLFARYYSRQLQPDELFESLQLVAKAQRERTLTARIEWLGQFARSMATDEGTETDPTRADIGQPLALMNSPLMLRATSVEQDGILRQVVQSRMSHDEKIEHLFLAAVSRKPTPRELKAVAELFRNQPEQQGLQDLWWALLNSNEFLLDH